MDNTGDILGQQKTSIQDTNQQLGNIDVATYFELPTQTVIARTVNQRVNTKAVNTGLILIWGNDLVGIWGTNKWADSNPATPTRIIENKMWVDYNEPFDTTTYRSNNSSVGLWDTSGSVFFSPVGSIQTINLGSDIQLAATKFTSANVRVVGSYTYLLTGSVSSDAGVTWTSIDAFGRDITINSTTGSEPVIKIVGSETDGNYCTLTNMRAYFHTSDVI